jgi:hypothetical protein
MVVSEFIELSNATVLKQLKVTLAQHISILNLALLEVYKQFSINTQSRVVTITSTGNTELTFSPGVIRIISVKTPLRYFRDSKGDLLNLTSNEEAEFAINEEGSFNSVFTFEYNKISVPKVVVGQTFRLRWDNSPILLTANNISIDLPVPNQYVELLLMYVAYLVHLSYGNKEPQADLYLQRYQLAVNNILKQGLNYPIDTTSTKLINNGFI